MPQTQTSGSSFDEESSPGGGAETAVSTVSADTDALDNLLDEIDESLQVNAEQFVRSFVQKGGQ